MKKLNHELRKLVVYGSIIFLLILIILFLRINIIGVFVSLFLIFIASISKYYKRFTGSLSVGFELVTPVVIIFAYTYGILFAFISSIIMLLVSSFISGKIDFPAMFLEVFTYLILSLLTFILSGIEFVSLAVFMIFLRNIIMAPLGVFLLGRNFIHMILIVSSDIFLNVLLIVWIGDFIVGLL
ncbi:MAG: hypothetical protein ACMXYG_04630 [Candidatus Woesearchaeota archaeon]